VIIVEQVDTGSVLSSHTSDSITALTGSLRRTTLTFICWFISDNDRQVWSSMQRPTDNDRRFGVDW